MTWNKKIAAKQYKSIETLSIDVIRWKNHHKKIVFTNGCFDILHLGHIDYLCKAADLGDKLIIGVNTDTSVTKLKGPKRPIIDQESRITKLASLQFVDAVILFDEETPIHLIKKIQPDVLVKGGDYSIDTIVGASQILKNGGMVKVIPFLKGYSSTNYIQKIKKE